MGIVAGGTAVRVGRPTAVRRAARVRDDDDDGTLRKREPRGDRQRECVEASSGQGERGMESAWGRLGRAPRVM